MNVSNGISISQSSTLYPRKTSLFSAEWIILYTSAIKRLNIVVGASVSQSYLETLQYIGFDVYSVIDKLFDDFEQNEINWSWRMLQLDIPYAVYLFKGLVKQDIRVMHRRSFHFEIWLYGLFPCADGRYRLAPLKRDSDFKDNIIQKLHSQLIKPKLPWA